MELTKPEIHTVRNEIFPSNTYLLKNERDDSCLIIDPGLDAALIDEKIALLGLTPVAVLSTHGHFDHIGSAAFFKEKFAIPFYLHEADLKISKAANFYLKVVHIEHKIQTPVPDFLFKGARESINISGFDLEVYNFPGHSNGSCAIYYRNCLFSGDIIYKKGLGFNSFPGENRNRLRESVIEMFAAFPDDTIVLPGHGEADYLGEIKSKNQKLIDFLSNTTTR